METWKKIVNVCLLILTICSLLVSSIYLYYCIAVKPNKITVGISYFGDMTPTNLAEYADDLSEEKIKEYEERVFFNINICANENNTGVDLNEMRLDYFTDYTMSVTSCRSVGIQCLFDIGKIVELFSSDSISDFNTQKEYFEDKDLNLYYYTQQDDISWSGLIYDNYGTNTMLNRDTSLIIKIDNKPYLIQLNGQREKTVDKTFLGIKYGEKTEYIDLTWTQLFLELIYSVETNSKGYGDFYLVFDCSDYFKDIKEYNPETGKFDKIPDVDISKNYSYVKFHYEENGAQKSSQSLFNSIACNSKIDEESNVEYWQERVSYIITESSLYDDKTIISYRYSEIYQGYFASINFDIKKLFANMPRSKVSISLNMDSSYLKSKSINLLGLDISAFEDFEIDTIEIIGTGTFLILDDAFKNTNIKTLKHSQELTLDISSTAFNNEYLEVIQ